MKTFQFQKTTKKLLPYVCLFGLLLVFIYGFPLTGSDLTFQAGMDGSSFSHWLATANNSGGNFFSAFLNGILVSVPVLRHILIAAVLGTLISVLISYCNPERPYMYFVLLFLALAAPKAIFAGTFSSTTGAGTALIPSLLTVLYIFTLCDLFVYKGKKKTWKIPMLFLSGLAVQFFSEGISVGILILSLFFLILFCYKVGFSWHLGAHSFGCILGFVAGLLIKGSNDVVADSFYTVIDRFSLALDQLFISNLLLLGILTLGCLLLIQPFRSERSKNCNITLFLLLVPMGVFVFLNVTSAALNPFSTITRFLLVLKIVAALCYCYGVLRTLQHYVSKDKIRFRVQNALIAVWIFVLAFSSFTATQLSMLYIPYILMVGATVVLLTYAFHRHSRMEKVLRKPLFFVGVAGVLALSFITFCNSNYSIVTDTHIRDSLSQGILEITLPQAPYTDRLNATTREEMAVYYDFPSYGDVKITYLPYEQWDWITYYEAHNVPVIEEYDENDPKNAEWATEFEEDN